MTPPASPKTQASPDTFKCWQDGIEDSEIEDFVNGEPPNCRHPWRKTDILLEPEEPTSPRSQPFTPRDADCGAWPSPSGPKCPASFGDRGTTATAGAFGQLVQFSTYLGAGTSGMFSAGHRFTSPPYSVVKRARNLLFLASEPFQDAHRERHDDVFGMKFLNLKPSLAGFTQPKLKWFQYRWPRYEYDRNCFNGMETIQFTIQFIVRDQTVFQHCILENRGKGDVTLELAFWKNMSVCDLDHVTDHYEFNETTSNQRTAGPGPGGFGWVHVNRFYKGSSGALSDSQHRSYEVSNSSLLNHNRIKSDYGVAVVTSMAVNGRMMRFCPGECPHTWEEALKATSKLEIVTAYRLVLLTSPTCDWKTFLVPLKEMNVNRFLEEAEAVVLFRTPITSVSRKDGAHSKNNEQESGSLKRDDSETEVDIGNVSQGGMATVESKPQTEPLPAVGHESTLGKTSTIMDRIEFTVRRNLQHILDVCAIPVAGRFTGEDSGDSVWEELRDVQAIALSCGDLLGHRICTTSSLYVLFLLHVGLRMYMRH